MSGFFSGDNRPTLNSWRSAPSYSRGGRVTAKSISRTNDTETGSDRGECAKRRASSGPVS